MNRFIHSLRILLTLALVAVTLPISAADKHALLIGVTKYEHAGMSVLKYPEDDARALGELLKSGGYTVEYLLGKNATQRAIGEQLEALRKQGSADGVIVLGLFGHGVEVETLDGTTVVTDGCFCPFDTDLRQTRDSKGKPTFDKNKQPLVEPDPATLVKLADIMAMFKLAKSGHRVVLADCCRTVPNAARGRSFGSGFKAQDLPQNTAILFGCSPGEQAFEHADWGHGAFTRSLLEQMPLMSSQGKVTTGSLGDRLNEQVPELVKAVSARDTQTPIEFHTASVDLQLTSLTPAKPRPPATPSVPLTGRYTSKSTGMTFEPIPAGTFLMGSSAADVAAYLKDDPSLKAEDFTDEQPQHLVRITRPFHLGTYEVTQGEYQKLTQRNPSGFSATGEGKEILTGHDTSRFPVENVSWYDAVEYCNLLSEADGLTPYYAIANIKRNADKSIESATVTPASGAASAPGVPSYRLPTEAEWEYASRAGTTSAFWFGSQNNGKEANVHGHFPFGTTTVGPDLEMTTTVGQYAKNAFGLHDTVGNVWEWCADAYEAKAYASRSGRTDDPSVNTSIDSGRISRGGSFFSNVPDSRSANRDEDLPDFRFFTVGFRVSRTQ